MEISAYSVIGTTRQDNQDSFYAAKLGDDKALLAVFDGMGGLSDGAKTSATVLKHVKDMVKKSLSAGILDVEKAVRDANYEIYLRTKGSGSKRPSGSTVTIMIIDGLKARIWHAGDSRAVLIRNNEKTVLTHDDTAYNYYYAEAKVPNDLYNKRKYKSTLVRAVGVQENVKLTIRDYDLEKGDTVLLCSDGFWHSIFTKDRNGNPLVALPEEGIGDSLKHIISQIEDKGEKDNITAVVVEGIHAKKSVC